MRFITISYASRDDHTIGSGSSVTFPLIAAGERSHGGRTDTLRRSSLEKAYLLGRRTAPHNARHPALAARPVTNSARLRHLFATE